MSLHDYQESQEISARDPPFYALIMACFRQADTHNLEKLQRAFPGKWREFLARYSAPGGRLEDELLEQIVEELPETILGRKVVIKEAGPRHVNLVLGDFDFYDYSQEEELDGT